MVLWLLLCSWLNGSLFPSSSSFRSLNKPYYYISIIVYVWTVDIYINASSLACWFVSFSYYFFFFFCAWALPSRSHFARWFFFVSFNFTAGFFFFFLHRCVLIWHYLVSHSMWDFFCIYNNSILFGFCPGHAFDSLCDCDWAYLLILFLFICYFVPVVVVSALGVRLLAVFCSVLTTTAMMMMKE